MSGEPETTLAWAEFLWRIAKEAPEVVLAYFALFEYLRRQWADRKEEEGRVIHLELRDSVVISDSLTATIGRVLETDTALPLRTPTRVTIGPAVEHDIALPIRAVGGAPS